VGQQQILRLLLPCLRRRSVAGQRQDRLQIAVERCANWSAAIAACASTSACMRAER
jgi:hypothetical protein